MCRAEVRGHWFLPGGHVETGEGAKEALARELREEIGVEAKIGELIGVIENFFSDADGEHQEINLVFLVEAKMEKAESLEAPLSFEFVNTEYLADVNFLPERMKERIMVWLSDKKPFWGSNI